MQIAREQSTKNLKSILKKICQLTNFSYGEIWLPDEDILVLSPYYHVVSDNYQYDNELFHECSKGFIMTKGEGLPGRVFLTKKPEWMLDVSIESEESFLRNKIAGICSVKTGFAIPVIKEEKVLSIMAFFACDIKPYSSECIKLAMDSVTKLSE